MSPSVCRGFSGILILSGILLAATATLAWPKKAGAQEFDINAVFWCDEGKKTGDQTHDECVAARTAILNNCTSCHAITPIVKAQKEADQWRAFLQTHKTRVPDIAEADYEQIGRFLAAHYNPKNPVPKLPPELDKLGVPPA